MNNTCNNCDGPINGSRRRKFCSNKCANDWHNKKSIKTECKSCGKLFQARIKELTRGLGRFCSLSCSAQYSNKCRKREPNTFCTSCNKPIYRNCLKFKTYSCSVECRQILDRKNRKNCSTNKYFGSGPKRKKFTDKVKEKYGSSCEICKWSKARCDVHHIIPLCKGGTNDYDNVIVLCPNHHRIADTIQITTRKELKKKL